MSNYLLLLFSGVVAAATAAYAILTWKLVTETRKMREVQTEPNVSVCIKSKEDYIGIIDLIIDNIGLGPAYNLRFRIEPDFEYDKGKFLSQINFIKNGINYLPPRDKRSHFLTSLIGRDDLATARYEFGVSYENCLGKSYQQTFYLDFSEIWGMRRVGEPALKKIAGNLEKIKESLQGISSGRNKIKVISYTMDDIEKETERQLKEFEQIGKEHKD